MCGDDALVKEILELAKMIKMIGDKLEEISSYFYEEEGNDE